MDKPLELTGICKRFGDKAVLEDFSLEFPSSGVVALLGPSGCGKTTLLRIIAGLERPDAGTLRKRDRLSMVFQEDRLIDMLCAADNIRVVLPPDKRRVAEDCLAGVGLADAAGLYPHEMSGGMKRRLAIARAVAYGGDILLLDEPFGGLDPATKEQVMRFVFGERGIAGLPDGGEALTLFVTHSIDEARAAVRTLRLGGPPLRVLEDTRR